MSDQKTEGTVVVEEKTAAHGPLGAPEVASGDETSDTTSLSDKDEAYAFLEHNPRRSEITTQAQALLDNPLEYRKLLRKIDFTIVPLLALASFMNLLDKVALEYASVMGIREDIHLVGQQYNNLGMFLYVAILAVGLPSQLLAQRISRLGLYLGVNIVLWGIVALCHGLSNSYAALAVVRSLLGVFESCVSPIMVLIVAMWYKKAEQGRRISWVYVMVYVSQIVGGLVAYGISFITSGYATWRIYFLTIGSLTICSGAAICILLPDSPVRARRFTEVEKVAVLLRMKDNHSGTQNSKIKKEQMLETLKDGRVLLIFLAMLLAAIPAGGFVTFGSILLTTFGYSSQEALILGVPRGAVGLCTGLLLGYLSDKLHDRSTLILCAILPTIMAIGLMIGFDPDGKPLNKSALLAGSVLTGTVGAGHMLIMTWNASNIAGHTKKVTTNALTAMCLALGSILGTQTFRATEAPGYKSGKITIISCLSGLCVAVIILRFWNDSLNRKNKEMVANMSEDEKDHLRLQISFADATDRKNPFFEYTH